MKNAIFGLIATVLFSFSGFANEVNNNFNGTIKINTVEKHLKKDVSSEILIGFHSLQDFENFTGDGIEVAALCDVSVTVSVGLGSTYASATVTMKDIDCNTIAAAIKKLKAQALAALEN